MESPSETAPTAENQTTDADGNDVPPQHIQLTAQAAGSPLIADSDETDTDSALGESVTGSYSTSLASSVTNYVYENGRRYHCYREGQYPLPNDEIEQDRLDMIHHLYRMLLGGNLYRAPLGKDRSAPMRVLDLGTGTGIWAMEMADDFPNAFVIGTDLSPIQPRWVPPNCKFYVDDFESDWNYRADEYFDYIHGRALCGSVGNWSGFFDQAYQNLNAGGWLEMQEYQTWLFSDDNTMENASWVKEWCAKIDEASIRFGKRTRSAQDIKKGMEDAGFVDVHEEIYKVPIGTWPKDKKLKELGKFFRAAMLDAIEPYTLALFTRIYHYSTEELQILMAGVRREVCNPKIHMYGLFHFVYGRKP